METNKLKAKDLINVGIYTAIYIVIFFVVGMLNAIPVLYPLLYVLIPLISGIPFMLFLTKIEKFGMVTIMSVICGVFWFLMGYTWTAIVGYVVFGIIADLVLKAGKYKSFKVDVIGYWLFSCGMIGCQAPMWVMADTYMAQVEASIADRVIYLKNGRIEQDMSAAAFGRLGVEQLRAMGLRSLHPANFSKIPAVSLGSNSIEIKNFLFSYGKMEAMNIPQLSVPQGAIVGILGDNGAGKTTFAKCLCGLEKSAQGFLRVGNDSLNAKQRLQKCYMVMQDVNHQLFTESVEDEILLSLPGENENADKQQAGEILENLNLLQFGKLHPMSLSGGQKQRVAIGSAIASDKEVLVFDEPTSGLDYHHMIEVARNLIALSKMGKTLFIITHDPELIAQCCNYFMFIEHGKIKWSGGWTDDNRHRLNDFFSVKL